MYIHFQLKFFQHISLYFIQRPIETISYTLTLLFYDFFKLAAVSIGNERQIRIVFIRLTKMLINCKINSKWPISILKFVFSSKFDRWVKQLLRRCFFTFWILVGLSAISIVRNNYSDGINWNWWIDECKEIIGKFSLLWKNEGYRFNLLNYIHTQF